MLNSEKVAGALYIIIWFWLHLSKISTDLIDVQL